MLILGDTGDDDAFLWFITMSHETLVACGKKMYKISGVKDSQLHIPVPIFYCLKKYYFIKIVKQFIKNLFEMKIDDGCQMSYFLYMNMVTVLL